MASLLIDYTVDDRFWQQIRLVRTLLVVIIKYGLCWIHQFRRLEITQTVSLETFNKGLTLKAVESDLLIPAIIHCDVFYAGYKLIL